MKLLATYQPDKMVYIKSFKIILIQTHPQMMVQEVYFNGKISNININKTADGDSF
jgi:hypothetical protein